MMNRSLSTREKAGLRGWAGHLHNVFSADDADDAAHLLNQLLDVVVTHPYITGHDGRLHLHYAPAEADPLHRVQASTAMGLAIVLCDYGMARLGVCRAVDCECVYVDVSRNAQRRFCSESCANRTNVAAFRARAKSSPTGASSTTFPASPCSCRRPSMACSRLPPAQCGATRARSGAAAFLG